jgi:ABC-2 type transport system permease protein
LLGSVAFAGVGLFFTGTLRAEANLALANGLFLLLLFLGGMAYPLSKLPGPLEAFARCSRPRRSRSAHGACWRRVAHSPAGSFVVLAAWTVRRAARCDPLLPLGEVSAPQEVASRRFSGPSSAL